MFFCLKLRGNKAINAYVIHQTSRFIHPTQAKDITTNFHYGKIHISSSIYHSC